MSQDSLVLANGSGAAFRAAANNALAALGSSMKGPSAPPSPLAGMIWVDDDTPSATVWTVKQYDGAEWIELGRLDITANIYIPSEGVIAWADVASAATVDLGAQASRSLRITGTTGISGFGTAASGVRKRLRIATGLTITHNATSLICPGAANLVLGAGDILDVDSLGSGNWVVTDCQPATRSGMRVLADAMPRPDVLGAQSFGGLAPNTAAILPAGGTWWWFLITFNSPAGTINTISTNISAGGTTVSAANSSSIYAGVCWRIV